MYAPAAGREGCCRQFILVVSLLSSGIDSPVATEARPGWRGRHAVCIGVHFRHPFNHAEYQREHLDLNLSSGF